MMKKFHGYFIIKNSHIRAEKMTKPRNLKVILRLEEPSQACHPSNSPYALEQFEHTCVLVCVCSCIHTYTHTHKLNVIRLKIINRKLFTVKNEVVLDFLKFL